MNGLELTSEKNNLLARFFDKLTKIERKDYKPNENIPSLYNKVNFEQGNLSTLQWAVQDRLIQKQSLTTIANALDKAHYSSIQKARNLGDRNIIQAFITVMFVLEDFDIMKRIAEDVGVV